MEHSIESILFILRRRSSQIQFRRKPPYLITHLLIQVPINQSHGNRKLTVQDLYRFLCSFQSSGNCIKVAAPINIPLYIIALSRRSKTSKSTFCPWLVLTVFGISVWIDGGSQALGDIGTILCHGALEFPQQSGNFILLWGLSLVLGMGILVRRARRLVLVSILILLLRMALVINMWSVKTEPDSMIRSTTNPVAS